MSRAPYTAFELYEQYRALPEGTKAEIVGGELRVLPRPRPRHVRVARTDPGRVSSGLGAEIASAVGTVMFKLENGSLCYLEEQ